MSLFDRPVSQLLEQTASHAPTPGGGSIAAVSAAFGVGLLAMSFEVSAVRHAKKGLTLTPDPRTQLTVLRQHLQQLADEDVRVFEQYMLALKAPPADKKIALHQATLAALSVPLKIAETSLAALQLVPQTLPQVIPSVISDIGAGAAIIEGATKAALLTAQINFSSLSEVERQEAQAKITLLGSEIVALSQSLQEEVRHKILLSGNK